MNVSFVLSAAAALLAVCALIATLAALQAVRRWRLRCESLESRVAALRQTLERVTATTVRTGRRLRRLEHEFSGVAERVGVLDTGSAGAEALDQAIDSARRGADRDRLAQQFGLSSGEADLVSRLHGRAKRE